GDATIVSKGSNETTLIRGGNITFTRGGQNITTFRNMRSGVISTDSNGIGIVEFGGMLSNLSVLTTIKSFNISQNIRSLHCYAENIDVARNKWRFTIGGAEASTSGHNETVAGMSFSKNCYSLSLNTITLTPSDPNCTGGGIYFASWDDKKSIRANITITYNDGLGGSRVIYSNPSYPVPTHIRQTQNSTGVCSGGSSGGDAVTVSKLGITLNQITLPVNQTFTTFNVSTKSISVKISYSVSSQLIDGVYCSHGATNKRETLSANKSYNQCSNSIAYTTENVQSLVGSGQIQYIAIEQ
ncbi:MAG: hypothetical protein ACRC0G_02320, partial [Fusobacteriaceae bacterium]